MRHQLSRHADVCARVGIHPQIAVNLTSTPVANEEGWWVIDDWVGEKTLADHLRTARGLAGANARTVVGDRLGLECPARAGIVFRELAPRGC